MSCHEKEDFPEILLLLCLETLGDNSYALTDEEYKFSLGKDYVFFEITEPEQLAYTYKVGVECQIFNAYDDCVSCGYSERWKT